MSVCLYIECKKYRERNLGNWPDDIYFLDEEFTFIQAMIMIQTIKQVKTVIQVSKVYFGHSSEFCFLIILSISLPAILTLDL